MTLRSDAGWSAPRIAAHLGFCGQTVRDLRRAFLARGLDALYRDPSRTLPAKRAGRILESLKAKADAGEVTLYYLDECVFAPTLPVGYSWRLSQQRKFVRFEAPQRRRVNAIAAYRFFVRRPRLEVFTAERIWDSCDLLGFLKALPWSSRPRVVVLDHASFHTGDVIRQALGGRPNRGSICTSCRRTAQS